MRVGSKIISPKPFCDFVFFNAFNRRKKGGQAAEWLTPKDTKPLRRRKNEPDAPSGREHEFTSKYIEFIICKNH